MWWILAISLVVLVFAILLHQMGAAVLETESTFKIAIAIFFALYILAAVAIRLTTPSLPPGADITSIGASIASLGQ